MCGIVGYIAEERRSEDAILESLQHRGPDDRGTFYQEINDTLLFLGHTRLSIIDLSKNGHQPMHSEDASIVMVYNGEVYNFLELKNKYLKDENFVSNTDSEVILKLYLKFGIPFLDLLNGDFAISIYDKNQQKLWIIRDRLGIKPLYYAEDAKGFYFASEIKAILKSGITAKLNQEEVQNYFTFKYVPQQETLFKGVKRLKPGHFICYDINSKTYSQQQYWQPEQNKLLKTNYDDLQQELHELIQDAVQIRTIADVSVGTFFSGGLDSSIIASCLKNKKEIKHYCAVKNEIDIKNEGTSSDAVYAKKLAKDWNLPLHTIAIGSDELNLDLIKQTLFYAEDLIADGSQIPSYLITKEAAKSSTVILSGMGADELFLGYAGHRLIALDLFFNQLPKFFNKGLFSAFASLEPGKGPAKAFKRYLHKLGDYQQYSKIKHGIYNIVGDYQSSKQIMTKPSNDVERILAYYFNDSNPFEGLSAFERDNFLLKNLHYTDRMSMANSVENRVPFLDHRIVNFASSLPRKYKMQTFGKSKRILKDSFSKEVPNYIQNRRKAGFGMPLRSIFSSRKEIDALIDLNFFNSFDCFSINGIEEIINLHLSGKKDNSALIYALIVYQEWYKMYLD